jgi:hypothetical protein
MGAWDKIRGSLMGHRASHKVGCGSGGFKVYPRERPETWGFLRLYPSFSFYFSYAKGAFCCGP